LQTFTLKNCLQRKSIKICGPLQINDWWQTYHFEERLCNMLSKNIRFIWLQLWLVACKTLGKCSRSKIVLFLGKRFDAFFLTQYWTMFKFEKSLFGNRTYICLPFFALNLGETLGCLTILCSTIQMDLVRRCFGLRSTNRT
jgi:hypothetical protein